MDGIRLVRKYLVFPISRDPPEGGTPGVLLPRRLLKVRRFPISRDPPEGGTSPGCCFGGGLDCVAFPISRDPPEGGTSASLPNPRSRVWG